MTDVIITWDFSSIPFSWLAGLTRPKKYITLPTPADQGYRAQVQSLGTNPMLALLKNKGITNPKRVAISGFSESCQGVMAFLRSNDAALIEHAILIDGVHCSWYHPPSPNASRDNVYPACIGPLIGYADWSSRGPFAVDGLPPAKRFCTITHSSIIPAPTPKMPNAYPATGDTAKLLLNKLFGSGWPKAPISSELSTIDGFVNAYGQHGLMVAGWSGNDAAAHIRQSQHVYQQVIRSILVPRWNAVDPAIKGCSVQTVWGDASLTLAPGDQCNPDVPQIVTPGPVDGAVPWQKYFSKEELQEDTAPWWQSLLYGAAILTASGAAGYGSYRLTKHFLDQSARKM